MLYLFGGARIILSLPPIKFRTCYRSVKRMRNNSIITCITSSKLNILQFKHIEKKQKIIYLSFSLQFLNLFIIMYYEKCVVVNKTCHQIFIDGNYSLIKKKQYCHMEYYLNALYIHNNVILYLSPTFCARHKDARNSQVISLKT